MSNAVFWFVALVVPLAGVLCFYGDDIERRWFK